MTALAAGEKRRRLVREFFGMGAGRALSALVAALWMVVAARSLDVAVFGDLALLLALHYIFFVIADFGLPFLLSEHIARDPSGSSVAVRRVLRTRMGLAFVAAICEISVYVVAGSDGRLVVPIVFSISMFATAAYTTEYSYLRARGYAWVEGCNEFISRVFVFAAGVFVLARGGGLLAVVAVYAAADTASALVLRWFVHRRSREETTPLTEGNVLSLRAALPLGLAGMLSVVYYRVDSVFLAILRSSASVGRYAAAYKILDGLLIPAVAIGGLLVPHTAHLSRRERGPFTLKVGVMCAAAMVPIAGIVSAFAGPILGGLFGAAYRSFGPVLVILMIGVPASAFVAVVAPVVGVVASRQLLTLMGVAVLVNCAANLALIPPAGAVGAAWATTGCQIVLAVALGRLAVGIAREERASGDVEHSLQGNA